MKTIVGAAIGITLALLVALSVYAAYHSPLPRRVAMIPSHRHRIDRYLRNAPLEESDASLEGQTEVFSDD